MFTNLSISLVIIVITCIISISAFMVPPLLDRCFMYPYRVKHNNEWWRFITSGFIHANWMHLFFNMFVLWSFGPAVEFLYNYHYEEKGHYFFVLLYLFGIIFSDLPTFAKWKDSPSYRSLGASGAVSAVLFAYVIFAPFDKILLMGILPMPAILWGGAYLFYSWYSAKQARDNINHDAHFFGALFGIVFTIAMKPQLVQEFINQILYQLN